jgi:hypothetical protein
MPEFSVEERIKEAVTKVASGDAAIMAVMAKAINDKYGEEGLNAIREAIIQHITPLFAHVGKQAGARVGNGDATDWVKIEHAISGVPVETLDITPTRARIRTTRCPRAKQLRKVWPDFCRKVWIAVEQAAAHAANQKLVVRPYEKNLASGDDCCQILCEFEE